MANRQAHDVWGFRTPPTWAVRALEKGIIDVNRFEALVRVASLDSEVGRRHAGRPVKSCSCRRRSRRACTSWRM